ncbi:transcriptional repressor NrdR [Candidatus Woesearchaeota archaeon]|nr:transcriptional repressor NrdR [Candidatus Woesearchaeota archaeon]
MKCPYCLKDKTKVLESRRTPDNEIRRRRECLTCQKRWTTYEKIVKTEITIIKRDGTYEAYNRDKILKGLQLALEKRGISNERIERAVDKVESKLLALNKTEIKSRIVGEFVMDGLKSMDEVAYVRFASVYQKFKDPTQFLKTITELKRGIKNGTKVAAKA